MSQMVLLVTPLVAIQFILILIALLDLRKREKVLWDNKWIWVPIIVLLQFFGPILYLTVGRRE